MLVIILLAALSSTPEKDSFKAQYPGVWVKMESRNSICLAQPEVLEAVQQYKQCLDSVCFYTKTQAALQTRNNCLQKLRHADKTCH